MKSKKPQAKIEASLPTIFTLGGEEFVTVKEAAKMLRKSVSNTRLHASNGNLISQKLSKIWVIQVKSIRNFNPPCRGNPHRLKK